MRDMAVSAARLSRPPQMPGAISEVAFQVRSGQIPAGCLKWSSMAVLTSVMPSQHGGTLAKVPISLELVSAESTP